MQRSWRSDPDKLTFIACLPLPTSQTAGGVIAAKEVDHPDRMIGDVNLFLTEADEDDEGCIGELELMIAPTSARRKGYGRATILAFMHYIQLHLPEILAEYKAQDGTFVEGGAHRKMKLLQLRVKIGSKNEKSIGLFESIGFIKVGQGPNYFGEIELVFEGFLGEQRTERLLRKYGVEEYKELKYQN